jgi:invasion protein IalB
MREMIYAAVAILAAGALDESASAQQQTQSNAPITVTGAQPAKKAPDPNEVVCEKERDSSSRIVIRQVCMTRGQWSEQRRLNRQDIDKAQTLRPM